MESMLEAIFVKPTMSEKKIVTLSNDSGDICSPKW